MASNKARNSRCKACTRCVQAKRRCVWRDGEQDCMRCLRLEVCCSKGAALEHRKRVASCRSSTSVKASQAVRDKSDLQQASQSATVKQQISLPKDIRGLLTAAVITMPVARLQLCITRLRSTLTSFTDLGRTPFLKASMDTSADCPVQEAFLACSAYRSQHANNQAFIASTLSRRYIKLVRNLHRNMSTTDRLVAIQAILVFQIMFLFDENHKLRELARLTLEDIDHAIVALQQQSFWGMQNSNSIDSDYDSWLMLESVRRTILAHAFIKSLCSHLEQGYSEFSPSLFRIPVTIHGGLWNAKNKGEWLSIIQEQKLSPTSLMMPYGEAIDAWLADGYQDVDDMHILLLSACRKSAPFFEPNLP